MSGNACGCDPPHVCDRHIIESLEALLERVTLVWLNDMIIGVYRTPGPALRHLEDVKQNLCPGQWTRVPGDRERWTCGEYARLELETVEVNNP